MHAALLGKKPVHPAVSILIFVIKDDLGPGDRGEIGRIFISSIKCSLLRRQLVPLLAGSLASPAAGALGCINEHSLLHCLSHPPCDIAEVSLISVSYTHLDVYKRQNLHHSEEITLAEAFACSCNSVFIKLALELGPEKLAAYAQRFGLGESGGLPLGEQAGNFPSPEKLVSPRAQANSALGQGEVMVSPLQAAAMMAVLANGGRRVPPRLVLALTDGQGHETARFWQQPGEQVLSRATANKMKYLLHEVVARGTAQAANITSAQAGAKTGTAESRRQGRELLNYWIAGFYPLEGTRAAVAVFADDLKEGTVQQVFGEIIYYLERDR